MRFTKMHGAGNDFIIIEDMEEKLSDAEISTAALKLCARKTGIGADGLMVIVPPRASGDFRMKFFNSDGSLGEMCGNGARCIARYGIEHGYSSGIAEIETTAGKVFGRRIDNSRYEVRLNNPSTVDLRRQVRVDSGSFVCAYVELGNPGIPHAVVIMPGLDTKDLEALRRTGSELRNAKDFPRGANVTFVKPAGPDMLEAVTYERGVEDFTLACGTGCGATVTALALFGLVSGKNVRVAMPGGELSVSLTKKNDIVTDIYLTGPTCVVCEGNTAMI